MALNSRLPPPIVPAAACDVTSILAPVSLGVEPRVSTTVNKVKTMVPGTVARVRGRVSTRTDREHWVLSDDLDSMTVEWDHAGILPVDSDIELIGTWDGDEFDVEAWFP